MDQLPDNVEEVSRLLSPRIKLDAWTRGALELIWNKCCQMLEIIYLSLSLVGASVYTKQLRSTFLGRSEVARVAFRCWSWKWNSLASQKAPGSLIRADPPCYLSQSVMVLASYGLSVSSLRGRF